MSFGCRSFMPLWLQTAERWSRFLRLEWLEIISRNPVTYLGTEGREMTQQWLRLGVLSLSAKLRSASLQVNGGRSRLVQCLAVWQSHGWTCQLHPEHGLEEEERAMEEATVFLLLWLRNRRVVGTVRVSSRCSFRASTFVWRETLRPKTQGILLGSSPATVVSFVTCFPYQCCLIVYTPAMSTNAVPCCV